MARALSGMSLVTMFRPLRAARSALSGECAPYQSGGCGFWEGLHFIGTVSNLSKAPLPGQGFGREGLQDQFEALGINLLPLLGVLSVIGNLERHRAAAKADLQ